MVAKEISLSPREKEVLELLPMGLSISEIGEELGLQYGYIKSLKKTLYGKLHANTTVEAVLNAMKWGLIPCACGNEHGDGMPPTLDINGREYIRIGR